jgi:hypothetical protein
MGFLLLDNTERAAYMPGVYECSNSAIHLYNDAEVQGTKAHIVGVHFTDGSGICSTLLTLPTVVQFISTTWDTWTGRTPISPVMAMFQDAPDFFNTTTSTGTISNYKIIN